MSKMLEQNVVPFFERLALAHPFAGTELKSVNIYTLLIAVVLSAQMTDRGVNRATETLFKLVTTPEQMLALGEEKLKEFIKSINLYPTKAKRIIELSKILIEKHSSSVPNSRTSLENLPGVGRKTANVILNVAFGETTIAVDTHVFRISHRAGLSEGKTPFEVEKDLFEIVPNQFLHNAHHYLLLHGRYVCVARNPICDNCSVNDICPKNRL